MKIFDKTGQLVLEVAVDDNSYRNRVIMGDHSLTLYYSLPTHVEIPVGSYCEFKGERYTLMRPERLKMKHTRLYEYTVTLSSEQDKAKIWKFRNPVDGRLKFTLTAKPQEHLQMLVDNMNRRDSGWTAGECVEDVEKLVSYDHDFCWDALSKMATEFKTEFEFVDKRVSLHKVEYDKSNPLPLSYGRGNGFKSGVGRSNSGNNPPAEILFVQGGNRNIDRSKYPTDEILRTTSNGCLLLPVGQALAYDGEHFEGEDGFNPDTARHYAVDDLGLSIHNIGRELTSGAEDSLDRSDDYPKRVGTISGVVAVDPDKNFYDFIDNSIPTELNYEDYLIGEEQMTVVFQSGELAGREFDVKYYHEPKTVGGKNKAGRRFEIVAQEIDGMMMPGGSFVPKPGDTYAVFNVMLPASYIRNDEDKSGASWDMFRAAVKHLFDNEEAKYTFTGELDGIWAKKDWANIGGKIRLGGFIRFTNEQFAKEGVLIRITAIKEYINTPHSPKIELSNETISSGVSSTIKNLESTEVVVEENHRAALQFTKRRFRDAKETIEMIEAALSDNFTSRINPIAVETMSLLVGDERLQYQFVSQPGSSEVVPHNIEWNEDAKQLTAPAGTIKHLTLGIDSIRPSHDPGEYLYWNVASFESASLTDGSVKYYLYIRANKEYSEVAGSAEFRLETSPHKLEDGVYYWLLVGVLNTEYDGERSFATLYGFTEILPGRITADRLVASDGQSYFDMLNSALKLKDRLEFNTDGSGQLKLRGVLVQSRSGSEAPLGCYRGTYDGGVTYFNGDEVTYRADSSAPISSYRCVAQAPIVGIAPTNSLSWQLIAAGVKGQDGSDGASINIKGNFIEHFGTVDEWNLWLATQGFAASDGATFLIDEDNTVSPDEPIVVPGGGEESDVSTQSDENIANDTLATAGSTCIVKRMQAIDAGGGVILSSWSTINASAGDAYIKQGAPGDGHLFVADTKGWLDVGNIKGQKGSDGAPGSYTEYRFAVNGSPDQAPALAATELTPAGWSVVMPQAGVGIYLWMTRAQKDGTGQTLISDWSVPVRFTPVDGRDGKDGSSPAMVFRGDYSPSETYYGNAVRLDCVRLDGAYYIARTDAPDGLYGFRGKAPTETDYWNAFGSSFESVATQLLLAENANIAGWIFRNNRLESEVQTSEGEPMMFLDGKQGQARLNGVIQLSCAYSGNISDANLYWLPAKNSTAYLTMGYEKEDIGKVVRLFNSGKPGQADYWIKCCTFGLSPGLTDATLGSYYAIVRPGECIELTCFRQPTSRFDIQGSWQQTGRFGMDNFRHAESILGRFPRMIAMGRISGSQTKNGSDAVPVSGRYYDGRYLQSLVTATRKSTGFFSIQFADGLLPDLYKVFCTGYGSNMKGATTNVTKAGFDLYVSDDATLNNGDIDFMIMDDNWWYDVNQI